MGIRSVSVELGVRARLVSHFKSGVGEDGKEMETGDKGKRVGKAGAETDGEYSREAEPFG